MDAVTTFNSKAPGIVALLLGDFPAWRADDACAVVGNAGHECLGFTAFQEMKPTVKGSRGGWGWMQWTGPRRRAFEAYCTRNKLDPASDKANYAWLFLELMGSEKAAVRKTAAAQGLFAKTRAFEAAFLRAGVKHYPSREAWAMRAREAWQAAGSPVLGTAPVEQAVVLRDEAGAADKLSADATRQGAATGGGGTIAVGGMAINHADWLLLGTFGLLVLAVVGVFAWRAIQNGRRADVLLAAADQVAPSAPEAE
jgi:hypothetical protein